MNDLTADASFTRIEEGVRRFWRLHGVPEAFYAAHSNKMVRTFHWQPLGVLEKDHETQLGLLAAGDLLTRYLTMRGDSVHNHRGWLCHGLGVELAVEQSLGQEVAGLDLAGFNGACRHTSREGVRRGEAIAARMAIWPSPGSTFLSLDRPAIGKVWSVLHRLYETGNLREAQRVVPFCPRCATPLSLSETGRHARQVERPSVWFRLPWDGEPNTYLLAFAAQPWMLVGMIALAAHPEASHVMVELPPYEGAPPARLILAEAAVKHSLPGEARFVRRISTRALRGARYRPPFTFLPADEDGGRVLLDAAVPQKRGTGLWPITPAFEPLSLEIAHRYGLPIPSMLDDWGNLDDRALSWRGLAPLDAEALLIEDLEARGLLFEKRNTLQSRSLCPHCQAAMFPLARKVWLVEGEGEPWVVSRDRAWGVPLPFWICKRCGRNECVAGLDDLAQRVGLKLDEIDPHRPAIDRLGWPCEACGGHMHRVPPVLDAAFEAAALSWAAMEPSSLGRGAGDTAQTNLSVGLGHGQPGWQAALSMVGALLGQGPTWDRLLSVPGGNIDGEAESGVSLERAGSGDALRWAALSGVRPFRAERDVLRPLWRWFSSVAEAGDPGGEHTGEELETDGVEAALLDRWLAARVHETASAVAQALDGLELDRATRALSSLVSDLVDWYAPFRPGAGGELLDTLTALVAPFLPHLAEAIHRQRGGRLAESVHLGGWPTPEPAWEDQTVLANMRRVQRLADLGERALADAGREAEQWTGRVVVGLWDDDLSDVSVLVSLEMVLARVLGAQRVQFEQGAASRVRYRLNLKPEQRVERGISSAEIEAVLGSLDGAESAQMVEEFREGLSVSLLVLGQNVTLLPADVKISISAQPGWIAAADDELLMVLEIAPGEADASVA